MVPQTRQRKQRNSSKVNLLISFAFHALILLVAFYFAARGGLLGHQLKKIAVEMVKEKPPPKPKEITKPKPETPQAQPPRTQPKVQAPKAVETPKASASTPDVAPPSVAPPAAELGAFEFAGGRAVSTSSDPVEIYRGLLQSSLTSKWNKPEDIADDDFVAEVQLSIGADGSVSNPKWVNGSGNTRWDDSVKKAVAAVQHLDRPPPANFPPTVIVRFDVQELTEPLAVQ